MKENPTAVVISNAPTPEGGLEDLLNQLAFWEQLDAFRQKADKAPADVRVFIKPDMEFYELDSPTGTDPGLVEHLIDLLAERKYINVLIGDSLDDADHWLENRDILILADLVGYQFTTKKGNDYEIVNLSENLIDPSAEKEWTLPDRRLSADWLEADIRINFAKNKTHEEYGYALGLYNLIGVFPKRAKSYHYFHRLSAPSLITELLSLTPVHFTLIDAWTSNHGSQGIRHRKVYDTRTLIGSNDAVLADWVAALKMGADPSISPVNNHALKQRGLPAHYQLRGDLVPYEQWQLPATHVRNSVAHRNQHPTLRHITEMWLQQVDTDFFPFKRVADAKVNQLTTSLFNQIDEQPFSYWGYVGLNYFLGNLHQLLESWRTLYDKDRIFRRETVLGFDPATFRRADFDAIPGYIEPLAQIVRFTPPDRNGLKWRYIDESVLFEYRKILPIPYEAFIDRVPIAEAVFMMYDNIGGKRQPVRYDRRKRILHQAERDLYLPQPNWMVFFGGKPIDVGKIEVIRYAEDRQEIFWRMVESANQSARYDDGMVRFGRHDQGTEIVIVARQHFELPLFWKVVNMDFFPQVKDALVSDAYVQFFSRTMAQYEAAYEGRSPYVGSDIKPDYGESGDPDFPMGAEQMRKLLGLFARAMQLIQPAENSGKQGFVRTDEAGYHHFKSGQTDQELTHSAREIIRDFYRAMRKDWAYLSNDQSGQQ